jgi:predicted ester cyclase
MHRVALGGTIPAWVKSGEGGVHMDGKETRAFAQQLMKEVWEPFASSVMPRFYHQDVVGHHRRAGGSTQELYYEDIANRLDWDKQTSANAVYDVQDIIAEEDRFAIRFFYTADFMPTGGKVAVEVMYFYQLRDNKVSEWWLASSADFDYRATDTEGMPAR